VLHAEPTSSNVAIELAADIVSRAAEDLGTVAFSMEPASVFLVLSLETAGAIASQQ